MAFISTRWSSSSVRVLGEKASEARFSQSGKVALRCCTTNSMPPRALPSRAIPSIATTRMQVPFTCPSCTLFRALARHSLRRHVAVLQSQRRRHASTFASPATVNKPIDVAPDKKELYHALEALKQDAAPFVNLSRLQLALRSLEGGGAKVRVAVLGVGDGTKAKRLARLLVADPLAERGRWESGLTDGDGEGGSVLVRYVLWRICIE
jgi:hypothetical protein